MKVPWISGRKQFGRATPLRVDYFLLTQSNLGACGQLANCACELPTARECTFDMLRWRDTKVNDIHDFTGYCYFHDKTELGGCFLHSVLLALSLGAD